MDTREGIESRIGRSGSRLWKPAMCLLVLGLMGLECRAQETGTPELLAVPFRVEPSQQRIGTLPAFDPRWWLPEEQGIRAPGVPALREALRLELEKREVRDAGSAQISITPDATLLDAFTPEERRLWSGWLAADRRNRWHRWPIVLDEAAMERLEARKSWHEALSRMRRWGISERGGLLFSEVAALADAFLAPADRRAFFQEVFGAETLLVKVTSTSDSVQAGEARTLYWHVNGRYRAIEPFMNAVAAVPGHDRIDVAHLLPRLPRALLYSYPPSLADAEDPDVESGMLAMDFFPRSEQPSTPDADADFSSWLQRACVPVAEASQYGDILVYGDPARDPWPYAAVHLADDVVFGRRPVAFGPWVFMRRVDIAGINPRLGATVPRVYRQRTALAPAQPPNYVRDRSSVAWRRQLALRPLPPGPWGRLWVYDVLLAPPGDTLQKLPAPAAEEAWVFKNTSDEQVRAALAVVENQDAVHRRLQELFATATRDADGRLIVRPSLDLVLETPAAFREALFPNLVGGLNATDAVQFIPFPTEIPIDEWFDTGALPATARDVLRRLAYRVEGGFAISDYGALYHVLDSPAERLAAQRAALRVPALVVLMEKPAASEVPALARYWTSGNGRNVQQFLESFAASEDLRFLDVVHLLPPVAREFLNTYFMTETAGPVPSCLWTTFNFGADVPDQRFLVLPDSWTEDGEQAWREFMSTYQLIDEPSQLGDVIVYRRDGAAAVSHACTYVAGGVVYTKNGFTFSAPWHLARLEAVDALYLREGVSKVYFRRVR